MALQTLQTKNAKDAKPLLRFTRGVHTKAANEMPVGILGCRRRHTCGLQEDGTPVCWGSNGEGRSSPPEDEG